MRGEDTSDGHMGARMGRLHRHPRGKDEQERPPRLRDARCVVRGVDWSESPPRPVGGSVRVYHGHQLLRALAVLHDRVGSGGQLHLPADIAPLVQQAYGGRPVGPPQWRDAMARAEAEHHQREEEKRKKARTFRLGSVGADGEAVMDWLDAHVGEADDDRRGRAQVRDTPAESVEVLVVVRRADGVLTTPPWLERDGGLEIPTDRTPERHTARTVAACTLALPLSLCTDEAVSELERRHTYPGWQSSPYLADQLVLDLDRGGTAKLAGQSILYGRSDGLRVGPVQ